MKKQLVYILFLSLISLSPFAQQKPADLDKSPMDVSYCPPNYPILKMNGKATEQPIARLLYSRPQKNGREIFGGIVIQGELWRLGANEATEIEFFRNVKVAGKMLLKGRYTMYAITNGDSWTVIFNTDRDIWGLAHNPKKDVLKIEAKVQNTESVTEAFTMYFEPVKANNYQFVIAWDKSKASFPFSY